jgi:DNA helicase HerA-like ATPase
VAGRQATDYDGDGVVDVLAYNYCRGTHWCNQNVMLLPGRLPDGEEVVPEAGRTVIVDMRDEWLEKDQALGLFLVLMHTFAQAEVNGRLFNKLMVFDEAHKYITESALIGEVVSMIREMRHWATSVVIASQDPLSVPPAVLALTSVLVLHRITAPEWIKHLRKAIIALEDVGEAARKGTMNALPEGTPRHRTAARGAAASPSG